MDKRFYTTDDIEELAHRLAHTVQDAIASLDSIALSEEYRRDFDGVSQGQYLLAKMIAEVLTDGRAKMHGLVRCDDQTDETTETKGTGNE